MDFALSEAERSLRDEAHDLLVRECPISLIRAHVEDPMVEAALRLPMHELLHRSVDRAVDLCLVLEQTGRFLVPGPFLSTAALFVPVMRAVDPRFVEDALESGQHGTVALAGSTGEWVPNSDPIKTFVLEVDRVDHVAIVSAGPTVAIAREPPCRLVTTEDTTRRIFDVDVSSIAVEPWSVDDRALRSAIDRSIIGLSAELVGTVSWLLATTVEYVKHRHAFGRPIGSFQAVQHKLANMKLEFERARAAVYFAAMVLDAGDDRASLAVPAAKAAVGAAVRMCCQQSLQLHGAVGYTWDHDLHLYVRRALASEQLLGTRTQHLARLERVLFAR